MFSAKDFQRTADGTSYMSCRLRDERQSKMKSASSSSNRLQRNTLATPTCFLAERDLQDFDISHGPHQSMTKRKPTGERKDAAWRCMGEKEISPDGLMPAGRLPWMLPVPHRLC